MHQSRFIDSQTEILNTVLPATIVREVVVEPREFP